MPNDLNPPLKNWLKHRLQQEVFACAGLAVVLTVSGVLSVSSASEGLAKNPTAKASSATTDASLNASFRQDLEQLEQAFSEDFGETGNDVLQVKLKTVDIKTKDQYRIYIGQIADLNAKVLALAPYLSTTRLGDTSFQRLSAESQELTLEYRRFNESLGYGQENFHSYQLLQTVVTNLNDAVSYWRQARKYRPVFRGSKRNAAEDDLVLARKLDAARTAIQELQEIEKIRQTLEKSLAEEAFQ